MDFLVEQQIWAIAMVVVGSFILSLCAKWEKAHQEAFKDPRARYGKTKEEMKPKSTRGTIMTTIGFLLCFGGMILFLMHVSL
jgi:hypothetical protein